MNEERWSKKIQITLDREVATRLRQKGIAGESYNDVVKYLLENADKKPKEANLVG